MGAGKYRRDVMLCVLLGMNDHRMRVFGVVLLCS